MEYGLRDIFTYLRWHYLNWGGRILYFFYEILFLRLGGLTLIRIVQSIVITVIAYETYLLARGKGKDSLLLAFADILLWGTISIKVLREGVYWFTASVLYVWPIAFFLAGILLYKGGLSVKRGKAKGSSVISSVLYGWIFAGTGCGNGNCLLCFGHIILPLE